VKLLSYTICLLFLLISCTATKPTYEYFSDCENLYSEFEQISSCGLKQIDEICNNEPHCELKNKRFLKIIKNLQTMLSNNEISDNEAMFRYLNIIDVTESNKLANRKNKFNEYRSLHFYERNFFGCFNSYPFICY